MTKRTEYAMPICCPECGVTVRAAVTIDSIETYPASMIIRFGHSSVAHTCARQPDTDGMRPLERFVKHGALDDQGREFVVTNGEGQET